MIKIFCALAVSAFVVAALFVLPGFAPPLETKPALKKGDRLISRVVGKDCAKEMWPNFSISCLHGKGLVSEVRLIQGRG